MNQKISFSDGLNQYISMALQLWPALQISIHSLPEAGTPPQLSPIPQRDYRNMSPKQFIQIMTKDLYNYIYQHNLKVDHIMDYLDDILAILNTVEQDEKTVRYMANQLHLLISQLPEGNATRLINFRQVYNSLKGRNIECKVEQAEEVESGSEEQQQMSDEDEQFYEQEECNIKNQPNQQIPQLVQEQEQKNEQDDGWIVVKKKSKR